MEGCEKMKVEDIKKLPKEFDFKSNINTFGILYHAKEEKRNYVVTCADGSSGRWTFDKKDFRRRLLKGDFVACL